MATPTPYDQASRYLVKLFPHESIAWMLGISVKRFEFNDWIDSKMPEQLGYPDRQTDTVASITRKDILGPIWAIVLEYQSWIDADMYYRITDYANKIEWHFRPTKNPKDRYQVGSIVFNLTGVQKPHRRTFWKIVGFLTDRRYRIINVSTLNASKILKQVEAGKLPVNILGFIPLMKGGSKPSIIKRWIDQASKVENKVIRADLGSIVKTFANLVESSEVWNQALEGWNMVESQYVKEITAKEKAISKAEGKVEATRDSIIKILRQRFGKSQTHEKAMSCISDLELLERMQDASFSVLSWDAILDVK